MRDVTRKLIVMDDFIELEFKKGLRDPLMVIIRKNGEAIYDGYAVTLIENCRHQWLKDSVREALDRVEGMGPYHCTRIGTIVSEEYTENYPTD